jgi:hypothetical protein
MIGISKQQQPRKGPKPMKPKKCRKCGEFFIPDRPFQKACKYQCAIELAQANAEQEKNREHRFALKAFNDSDKNILKRKAIQVFNEYIRKRDKDLPCVSCDCIVKEGMAHASHFKPANTYSYLRFDEANVHKSCSKCNVFLSGNLDAYRIRIVERIGQEELDRLDLPNKIKAWSIDELKDIIQYYKAKIKAII